MRLKKVKNTLLRPETTIYVYFFVVTSVLALTIRFGVPPDEVQHFDTAKYYAGHNILPISGRQASNFDLGSVQTDVSYLYHYFLGLFYRFFGLFNLDNFTALRFVNVFMGLSTLVGLNYLAKMLGLRSFVRLVLLFVIANIPMFLVLSSAINYDNLLIPAVTLSIILTLKFLGTPRLKFLYPLVLLVILGSLIKISFLPISAVIFIIVTHKYIKNRSKILKENTLFIKRHRAKAGLAAALIVFSLGLFSLKYVNNELTYGKLEPKCNQVLTHEQCLQFSLYSRSVYLDSRQVKPIDINPESYGVQWLEIMNSRIYGLHAHEQFSALPAVIGAGKVLSLVLILLFVRGFRFVKDMKYYVIPLVFAAYTIALVAFNIKNYRHTGSISFAVQGRYIFPVLFPMVVYIAHLYNRQLSRYRMAVIIGGVILAVFAFIAGPVNLIQGLNDGWRG